MIYNWKFLYQIVLYKKTIIRNYEEDDFEIIFQAVDPLNWKARDRIIDGCMKENLSRIQKMKVARVYMYVYLHVSLDGSMPAGSPHLNGPPAACRTPRMSRAPAPTDCIPTHKDSARSSGRRSPLMNRGKISKSSK